MFVQMFVVLSIVSFFLLVVRMAAGCSRLSYYLCTSVCARLTQAVYAVSGLPAG